MYLRTPKRYTRGHRRSLISFRWLWLWILTPVVVIGGLYLYNNREQYIPKVQDAMVGIVDQAQMQIATAVAPTPLPTEDPVARLVTADAAWERGALEEAVSAYQEILPSVPNRVDVYYRLTMGLINSGRLTEALNAAESTVTANPYDPNAWAIRAMTLDWNGRYGEAVGSALRAIELAGDNNADATARAQAFLAEAYYDLGQYDRALSTVNRALEANPDSYEAYRNRANIVQNTQFDFTAALEDLRTAHDLAPQMPYITIDLAILESREGNTDQGIALLTDVVDLNPKNSRALYWLGWQYLNVVGEPTQAMDYLTRCVESTPDNISCYYILGRAQVRAEQYAAAADSFQRTLDLGSNDPYHIWWAGHAQVLLGNCPAASPFFQRGYPLALLSDDQVIIDSYKDQMQTCGMIAAEATQEATQEPDL